MNKSVWKKNIVMPITFGTELKLDVTYKPTIISCRLPIKFVAGNNYQNILFQVVVEINKLQLRQMSTKDGDFTEGEQIPIDNLEIGPNSLRVLVGTEKFEVFINGKGYPSYVATDRLREFSFMRIFTGSAPCILPIADSIYIQHTVDKGIKFPVRLLGLPLSVRWQAHTRRN